MLICAQRRAVDTAALRELGLCKPALFTNPGEELGCDIVCNRYRHTRSVTDPLRNTSKVWQIRHNCQLSTLYPIATIRSIGTRAFAAVSASTRTSYFPSRSASRRFGSVIIFMNLHDASALAGMKSTSGAAICKG